MPSSVVGSMNPARKSTSFCSCPWVVAGSGCRGISWTRSNGTTLSALLCRKAFRPGVLIWSSMTTRLLRGLRLRCAGMVHAGRESPLDLVGDIDRPPGTAAVVGSHLVAGPEQGVEGKPGRNLTGCGKLADAVAL